jgi:hypothetical protein
MVGANAMGGVAMSRTYFGVLRQNLAFVFVLYVLQEAASLTSTVQSICETEDKGRDKVGIDDAPIVQGFASRSLRLLRGRTGLQM